jgi:Tfp pilus assembly protein PilO
MSRDRLWVIAAVAGMLVVAVAGWFLGISPVVAKATAANAQISSIRVTNAASLSRLTSLKQQTAGIGTLQKSLAALRDSIPEDADASVFLQELGTLSAAHNVTITSVTIASATVYTAPVAATPAADSTDTTDATSTPTPTPTPTPTSTTAPTTATTPAATNPFVLVPVSITVTGAFDDVRDFIGAVQGGSRLYLATEVSIVGDASSATTTGTLTGDVFTLQGTSPESTPAPTPKPKPTATPTPTPTATETPIPTSTPTSTPAP